MPDSKYGDKIHVKKIGRFENGKHKYIHIPQIEIYNEKCGLADETTKSTFIECDSHSEALETGTKCLEELKALEALQRLG